MCIKKCFSVKYCIYKCVSSSFQRAALRGHRDYKCFSSHFKGTLSECPLGWITYLDGDFCALRRFVTHRLCQRLLGEPAVCLSDHLQTHTCRRHERLPTADWHQSFASIVHRGAAREDAHTGHTGSSYIQISKRRLLRQCLLFLLSGGWEETDAAWQQFCRNVRVLQDHRKGKQTKTDMLTQLCTVTKLCAGFSFFTECLYLVDHI